VNADHAALQKLAGQMFGRNSSHRWDQVSPCFQAGSLRACPGPTTVKSHQKRKTAQAFQKILEEIPKERGSRESNPFSQGKAMNSGCYLGTANLQKTRSAEDSRVFIVKDFTNLRGSKSRRRVFEIQGVQERSRRRH
jgi:hypothetical protein